MPSVLLTSVPPVLNIPAQLHRQLHRAESCDCHSAYPRASRGAQRGIPFLRVLCESGAPYV